MNASEMIQALRKVGFSEESIAYGVNVNKSTISRILNGKTPSPRLVVSTKIKQLFFLYCQ